MSRAQPVIIVEDNDGDFETAVDAMESAGIGNRILRVTSGSDFIRLLREVCAGHVAQPAFVLMDLNTPGGDGRDALSEMRKHDKLRTIPVVVLSTSSNPKDVDFCYDEGIRAYHIKPVDHAAHQAILRSIFSYWMISVVPPGERRLKSL